MPIRVNRKRQAAIMSCLPATAETAEDLVGTRMRNVVAVVDLLGEGGFGKVELVQIRASSGRVYLCVVKTMVSDNSGFGAQESKAEEVSIARRCCRNNSELFPCVQIMQALP